MSSNHIAPTVSLDDLICCWNFLAVGWRWTTLRSRGHTPIHDVWVIRGIQGLWRDAHDADIIIDVLFPRTLPYPALVEVSKLYSKKKKVIYKKVA